jgi:hypothetical protein
MNKVMIVSAVLALMAAPALAVAGPSVGIDYTDMGLSGHAGRPGVTIGAGNLYSNNAVVTGSATFARGFYGFHADLGKLIPAGGVSFEPYVSLGFLNLNYNQQEMGGLTSTTTTSPGGFQFTQFTQQYYQQQQSISDFYGLAGVNLNVPIGRRVAIEIGGGYGHTITTYGGNGGAVYRGKAEIGMQIAHNVTANLDVAYLHVPGASLTNYGAGIAYRF